MKGYFIINYYECSVAFWISKKGYFYRQINKRRAERICGEDYYNAYEEYINA